MRPVAQSQMATPRPTSRSVEFPQVLARIHFFLGYLPFARGFIVMATGGSDPAAAATAAGSSAQFALLMDAIKRVEDSVDTKPSTIKKDLTLERESADDRLVKKLRLDSKPSFRKKGNEKQYVFNEQVRDKLVNSVSSALSQTPPAVEKAKALIKEDEKLIEVRQKHIKIADRSEYGWATVA